MCAFNWSNKIAIIVPTKPQTCTMFAFHAKPKSFSWITISKFHNIPPNIYFAPLSKLNKLFPRLLHLLTFPAIVIKARKQTNERDENVTSAKLYGGDNKEDRAWLIKQSSLFHLSHKRLHNVVLIVAYIAQNRFATQWSQLGSGSIYILSTKTSNVGLIIYLSVLLNKFLEVVDCYIIRFITPSDSRKWHINKNTITVITTIDRVEKFTICLCVLLKWSARP